MTMVFEPVVEQDCMAGTYGRWNHRQDERERGKRVETHNPHHRIVPVTCWHPTRPCLLKGLPSPTVVCKHMTHFYSLVFVKTRIWSVWLKIRWEECVLLTVVRVSHTNKQVKWVSVLFKLSTNNVFLPAYCTHTEKHVIISDYNNGFRCLWSSSSFHFSSCLLRNLRFLRHLREVASPSLCMEF